MYAANHVATVRHAADIIHGTGLKTSYVRPLRQKGIHEPFLVTGICTLDA